MRKELDDLLCRRYPEMFAARSLPDSESCMGRGFECGDGWFELIDRLCGTIQCWVNQGNMPPVHVTQVKEKLPARERDYSWHALRAQQANLHAEARRGPGKLLVRGAQEFAVRCRDGKVEGIERGERRLARARQPGLFDECFRNDGQPPVAAFGNVGIEGPQHHRAVCRG